LVGGPSDSGEGLTVLRKREGALELGELRATQDGKPIAGELVRLSPRKNTPRVFDVEVLHDGRPKLPAARGDTSAVAAASERGGPPQVATAAYRANYDAVFRKRRRREQN
jgi:hypothetical protein